MSTAWVSASATSNIDDQCCERRQAALEAETAAPSIADHALVEKGVKALPYALTKAQECALDSILEDLKGPIPLDGLLQVD